MVYEAAPKDFNPKFEVVSCLVQHDKYVLLLLRNSDKSEGGKWGTPTGKFEPSKDKTIEDAMRREFKEETGLTIDGNLKYLKKLFVNHLGYDFVFHVFHTFLPEKSPVIINPKEHQNSKWSEVEEALKMDLVADQDIVFRMFYPEVSKPATAS